MQSIVVFCGSSEGVDPFIVEQAYQLGKTMALQRIRLIYGAAKIGLMGKVAQGAMEHQGTVIGVIPEFLMKKEVVHTDIDELIITHNMHERKLKMHELSEGIIALPGGYGTLEELFEMITWGQLGLHQKPIGVLNTKGFYDHLLVQLGHMVSQGLLKQQNFDMLLVEDDIAMLLERMRAYQPIAVPKWIHKGQE